MAKYATTIQEFQKKEFGKNSSPYIKLEARIVCTFLHALVEKGYRLIEVNDTEEIYKVKDNNPFAALKHIFDVDEAYLLIKTPNGNELNLFLLLGEGETYTIADCGYDVEADYDAMMEIFKEAVKKESEFHYDTYWV